MLIPALQVGGVRLGDTRQGLDPPWSRTDGGIRGRVDRVLLEGQSRPFKALGDHWGEGHQMTGLTASHSCGPRKMSAAARRLRADEQRRGGISFSAEPPVTASQRLKADFFCFPHSSMAGFPV